MRYVFKIRRDTAANFAAANPVLADGELAYETDTGTLKIGDGTVSYTGASSFLGGGGGSGGLTMPLDSTTITPTTVDATCLTVNMSPFGVGDDYRVKYLDTVGGIIMGLYANPDEESYTYQYYCGVIFNSSVSFSARLNVYYGLLIANIGPKIAQNTGAVGKASLSSGSATISTSAVTSTCLIFLTSQVAGGTPGWLRVSARTNGVGFTVTSSSGSDTSEFAWMIIESD